MEKLITRENLRNFAYCNDHLCSGPIQGLVISFFGLGCTSMIHEDPPDACKLAEKNILYLFPYNDPWCWMNAQAVAFTDELVDVLFHRYGLPEDLPIISSGSSMGGQSALTYMHFAKRTPVACVVNCPVCDLPFHFTERPDLPRTLYNAFYHENGSVSECLARYSPLHLAPRLPKAEYVIFYCENDCAVSKKLHSDPFVAILSQRFPVTYYSVPGRDHCDLPAEMLSAYLHHLMDAVLKNKR
ncbi:MAG: hypothetical protein IKD06_03350 [Clostridia bacterium]|nr:hypothetical protein [Clostridia bacterium]